MNKERIYRIFENNNLPYPKIIEHRKYGVKIKTEEMEYYLYPTPDDILKIIWANKKGLTKKGKIKWSSK